MDVASEEWESWWKGVWKVKFLMKSRLFLWCIHAKKRFLPGIRCRSVIRLVWVGTFFVRLTVNLLNTYLLNFHLFARFGIYAPHFFALIVHGLDNVLRRGGGSGFRTRIENISNPCFFSSIGTCG